MRELTDMEMNAVCGGANNGGVNQQASVGSVGNFFSNISGANNGGVNQQANVANAFSFR